jgi:chromosome segregation ATPase
VWHRWLENASSHIARIVNPVDHIKVFKTPPNSGIAFQNAEVWNPPPQPKITFLQAAKKNNNQSVPKTINPTTNKKGKSKTDTNARSDTKESDNNKVVTMTSQTSYSQSIISDLQSESRQHSQQLENHIRRMNTIEINVKKDIQKLNSQMLTLDNRYNALKQGHYTLFHDVENLAEQLPTLTETMSNQQDQLSAFITEHDEKHKSQQDEIITLKQTQLDQAKQIATLQSLVNMFQAKTATPISPQKIRKKQRNTSSSASSTNHSNTCASDDHMTAQLDMVAQSIQRQPNTISDQNFNKSPPENSFMETHDDEDASSSSNSQIQGQSADQLSPTIPKDLGNFYQGDHT